LPCGRPPPPKADLRPLIKVGHPLKAERGLRGVLKESSYMQDTRTVKERMITHKSPLINGVAPTKSETGVVQLLKDADAHADCKAELIFYDSYGNPSAIYKMTGKMVRRWMEK
jgi:hypothetical protein